jgi:hypothetical protein
MAAINRTHVKVINGISRGVSGGTYSPVVIREVEPEEDEVWDEEDEEIDVDGIVEEEGGDFMTRMKAEVMMKTFLLNKLTNEFSEKCG